MGKSILIITSSIDVTVDCIIKKYWNIKFFRFDVDKFASYEINVSNSSWKIKNILTNNEIEERNVLSIYYRKPIFPDLSEYENYYHSMIEKDILALITGIVDSFDGKVLSKPYLLRLSENKINQLIFASMNNYLLPKSFIGNDNHSLVIFSDKKAIIKPLTTGKVYTNSECELYQTSYYNFDNDDISLTPIYLQDYIPKQYEARITVINNKFYTVRIDTLDKLDWRKDYENHKYTLIECPEKIKNECIKMLLHYNISFGAFDYIVTPNNDWVFLELNPNGQWLWLEEALNLDISKKIIEYLCEE